MDVGSNSVLLYIAERRAGSFEPVMDRLRVSRLGEGLRAGGVFSEAAMARTVEAICELVHIAHAQGVRHLAAVGTMAMRSSANSDEFVSRVQQNCGVHIEVISGQTEARLAYMGALDALCMNTERVVVMDVGGGSTELIYGTAEHVGHGDSLDVGALHMTEKHLKHDPPEAEDLDALMQELHSAFSSLQKRDATTRLVGVGGTITTMSAVKLGLLKYDSALVHASTLSSDDVKTQVQQYSSLSLKQRCRLPGLPADRADIILAGAIIVSGLMDRLGFMEMVVSDRGVRHGLMLERFA